jgi:sugar phosphate isomerase/epimerase
MIKMKLGRRDFNKTLGAAALGLSLSPTAKSAEIKFPIVVFSKHLQFLNYEDMAATAKEIGFDGIDLTVRPKGHVLPENVTRDLPKAVKAINDAGLETYMMTTAINDAGDQFTAPVLKTAGELGIKYYRMGYLRYDDETPVEEELQAAQKVFNELTKLNKKYGIVGCYQNHARQYIGSPIWDLWLLLKDLEPDWIGSQYDIRHATVEGASAWPMGLELLQKYIHTLVIKDFYWHKEDGEWNIKNCPIGEGMVDFRAYFRKLKQLGVNAPISVHFEYPIAEEIDDPALRREHTIRAMRKDLKTLRTLLKTSGLI